MRVGISAIAWDVEEDDAVAALLARRGIGAIDVAPGKYFAEPEAARDADIAVVRRWWSERGFEITGMQSLLFGTTGLNVFGDAQSQQRLRERLQHVMRIGAGLGATRLVFGSPKNRDRTGWTDDAAQAHAADYFAQLGEDARATGVTLCLEPNPARYGCNFACDAAAAAALVRTIDHPNLRMQLDIGALAINGEDIAGVLARDADLIGHVHASEPDLVTLGDGGADHANAAAAFRAAAVPGLDLVTIEMVAARDEPHLAAVDRAVALAMRTYGATA